MIKRIEYEVNFINIYQAGKFQPNANSVQFINQGTSTAIIKGLVLYPQQGLTIDGNITEVDVTQYDVSFDTSSGIVNNLYMITKIYRG